MAPGANFRNLKMISFFFLMSYGTRISPLANLKGAYLKVTVSFHPSACQQLRCGLRLCGLQSHSYEAAVACMLAGRQVCLAASPLARDSLCVCPAPYVSSLN